MNLFSNIEFARPGYLYLLVVLVPLIVWYVLRYKNHYATIKVSTVSSVKGLKTPLKQVLKHVLFGVRLIGIALLILALARPQSTNKWENVDTLGIDVMLSMDISGSMLARDFKPDRLEAAKNVGIEFISGRPNDRMGLVVFSGESFTQCPLTTDHAVLVNLFQQINSEMIQSEGTAIGIGLANAVKRLKDSEAISKVIILLTDGVNNQGAIDPLTAAEIAKTFNIRVYTVGVGTIGEAPYPAYDIFGRQVLRMYPVEIDEPTLKQIAEITGGEYFRATNNNALREIYAKIDKLEKSKINVKEYSRKEEKFMPLVWLAFALLLVEILLSKTVLRSIP